MTYTTSNVPSSASSVKALDAKAGRGGFSIRNNSTAWMYVEYGADATTSSLVPVAPGGFYEDPYARMATDVRTIHPQINLCWASENGSARVMEVAG